MSQKHQPLQALMTSHAGMRRMLNFWPPFLFSGITVLEVAKVLTAAWLSHNWKRVNFFLKTYLTFSVVVLMLITSLGIFGFLSKAHIEQTSSGKENVAQIEITEKRITRLEEDIVDFENQIEKIENSNVSKNKDIAKEIEKEEQRIEDALANYQRLVDEQNEIITSSTKKLDLIDRYLEEENIKALQTLVGTTPDGQYGRNTAKKVTEFREKEEQKAEEVVASARQRINELRDNQGEERRLSNDLIDRLRKQISLDDLDEDDKARISNIKKNILTSEEELTVLNNIKFEFEKEVRKFEAEVGPVKYVAEVLYSDVDENVLEDAIKIIENSAKPIAAFITEPVVGCGGQVPLAKGYLKHMYLAIRKQGGICISDEVQTGFGRLGNVFWGFEAQEVVPDIVIVGKPMANGHPTGAVVCTTAIADSFSKGVEFFSSFGGNPVSCAIANAVLEEIETGQLQQNAKDVGAYYLSLFKALQKKYNCIGDVRGSGLFIGVEIVKDNSIQQDYQLAKHIKNELRNKHILVSTDGPFDSVIKTKPPLCFTKENAKTVVDAIDIVLEEYYSGLG